MEFANALHRSESHQRTIIHLDMDYFYAQVEEIRNPDLRSVPLGVQQKNIVVTCNYNARSYGVKKLMLLEEAKRLCPALVLVKGEDLTPYRQMSQQIFDILVNYTPLVEKLGFDENFMDVSSLVEKREQQKEQQINDDMDTPNVVGNVYPSDGATLNACSCGCANRLAVGTQIAQEIRQELNIKLGLTSCAGISYNKLLAKLVGSQYKPNQQTVLVSSHAEQFMRELYDLNRITGIGTKTESLLIESGVANVEELQGCNLDFLKKKFGYETAMKLKDLAFGRDSSAVRPTGKPKSIGLEDSCKPISVRTDVEDRFRLLLMRLMEQVAEDGRIPICVKVVLRKFDSLKKCSHRETKQVNIMPSLFKSSSCTDTGGPKVMFVDGAQDKLLKIIMRLFERIVDLSKPFNITLIGLAFSKFQQRKVGSSSIANFLIKKTDLEVQSITSLTNTDVDATDITGSLNIPNSDEEFRSSPTTFQPSDQFYRRRTTVASPIPMLVDNGSESGATNSDFSDFSETEVEPSPKKSRISRQLMNKRRCFGSTTIHGSPFEAEISSPSKLRVSDLRLNSRDSDREFPVNFCSSISQTTSTANSNATASTSETMAGPSQTSSMSYTTPANRSTTTQSFHPFQPTQLTMCTSMDRLDNFSFASDTQNVETGCFETKERSNSKQNKSNKTEETSLTLTTTVTSNLSNIPCPAGVDPQVFNELPVDVQNELIASWKSSLAAAVANASSNSPSQKSTAGATNTAQKNTLYRYFLRNK